MVEQLAIPCDLIDLFQVETISVGLQVHHGRVDGVREIHDDEWATRPLADPTAASLVEGDG